MRGLWVGLIIPNVVDLTDSLLETGAEADAYVRQWAGHRVHVAEAIAGSLGALEINVSKDDVELVAQCRKYGATVTASGYGVVSVTSDGRVALGLGRGRVVESVGGTLAIVNTPGAGRYTSHHWLPGVRPEGITL